MKKFNAVNKRNQKGFILTFLEDGKVLALDVAVGSEKEISMATVKRWYEIGEEILPEVKKEKDDKKSNRSAVRKDGMVRKDKFRPKLNANDVYSILCAFHSGMKKSHLACEYGVSFRTITCIVEGLMWKDVYGKFHADRIA